MPVDRRRAEQALAAKAICAGCPSLVDCRAYALADEGLLGIWGGTTTAERRALRKRSAA